MSIATDTLDLNSVAGSVLSALSTHRQIPSLSRSFGQLSIANAYQVTPLLRAAFEARGERVIGRKIGFTNRQMWAAHGVQAPIWGYCTDRTTHELADVPFQRVKDFAEPRIEPEIVLGLGSAPLLGMDEPALLECIDWVALGYEIVQSVFPGWQFTPADTIAANALHGALLVGNRHAVAPRKRTWHQELAAFRVELYCNEGLRSTGAGAFVLGSPLAALRYLVELLATDKHNPRSAPVKSFRRGR